jgi:hypothetical protein
MVLMVQLLTKPKEPKEVKERAESYLLKSKAKERARSYLLRSEVNSKAINKPEPKKRRSPKQAHKGRATKPQP